MVKGQTGILGYACNEKVLQQIGLQYVIDKHTNIDKCMNYNNRLHPFLSILLYC